MLTLGLTVVLVVAGAILPWLSYAALSKSYSASIAFYLLVPIPYLLMLLSVLFSEIWDGAISDAFISSGVVLSGIVAVSGIVAGVRRQWFFSKEWPMMIGTLFAALPCMGYILLVTYIME
jgi:membrane associated rhomboid family serine protease